MMFFFVLYTKINKYAKVVYYYVYIVKYTNIVCQSVIARIKRK